MNTTSATTAPRKVVAYIRGSTEKQENTLEAQRQTIDAYAKFKGLVVVGYYTDSGTSGSSSFCERPVAAEMLTAMKELGAVDIVITKLDRGFRNALDCLFTLNMLQSQEIGLHLLDLQLDTRSPMGMLLLTIMAALAEFENKRRAERQIDAFNVMRKAGQRCGTIPYGWQPVTSLRQSKTGRQAEDLIPHPEEQKWLRFMKVECEGLSDNEVSRRLNAQGVPAKKGGKWFGATVAYIRKNGVLAEDATGTVAA